MRLGKHLTILTATLVLGLPGMAIAQEPNDLSDPEVIRKAFERLGDDKDRSKEAMKKMAGNVDAIEQLPINGLAMVEGFGQTALVSANGRFVIMGEIYDVWNGKKLEGVADAKDHAKRIDFEELGLDVDDLATLTIGGDRDTDREVVLFADPGHERSQTMIDRARSYLANQGEKAPILKVVISPYLDGSAEIARRLVCVAKEEGQESALSFLLDQNYSDMSQYASSKCGKELVMRTLASNRMLGINSVPYWVNSKGQMKEGLVDLASFLNVEDGDKG